MKHGAFNSIVKTFIALKLVNDMLCQQNIGLHQQIQMAPSQLRMDISQSRKCQKTF